MVKGSLSGGVKPMSITGRYQSERERLLGMTEEERQFRHQWLKDQELSPNEPKVLPQMYQATYNPLRRLYRFPLNQLQNVLEPIVGANRALHIRYFSGKILLGIAGAYLITYYFKYNANDWTRKGGWKVIHSRTAIVEGDPRYPQVSDRSKPEDYGSRGFKNFNVNL